MEIWYSAPALLKQCKVWINCAFNLAKGFQNLQDLKLLLAERVDQSFLQISTNAVLCYHRKPEDNELLYRKGGRITLGLNPRWTERWNGEFQSESAALFSLQ